MNNILAWLAPTLGAFLAGWLLRRLKIVKAKHGSLLMRIAFTTTIPIVAFISIAETQLVPELFIFTALPFILLVTTYVVAHIVGRKIDISRGAKGVFLAGPMTINTSLVLAFMLATFQTEGALRVALFNAGFFPLLFFWVYVITAYYNADSLGGRQTKIWQRVALSPPLWGIALGIMFNVLHIGIAAPVSGVLHAIGNSAGVVTLVALGIVFTLHHVQAKLVIQIIAMRMLLGLAIGLMAISLFHLEGIDRTAVLALACGPAAANLLTFATVQHLDVELAASVVSYSTLIAMFTTPVIILLTS